MMQIWESRLGWYMVPMIFKALNWIKKNNILTIFKDGVKTNLQLCTPNYMLQSVSEKNLYFHFWIQRNKKFKFQSLKSLKKLWHLGLCLQWHKEISFIIWYISFQNERDEKWKKDLLVFVESRHSKQGPRVSSVEGWEPPMMPSRTSLLRLCWQSFCQSKKEPNVNHANFQLHVHI